MVKKKKKNFGIYEIRDIFDIIKPGILDFGNFEDFFSIHDIFMNDDFLSQIENIFREHAGNFLVEYDITEMDEEEPELGELDDYTTDASVIYVPRKYLPQNNYQRTLGLYDPNTHTIYIADDLPPNVKKFVYYHEIAHSLGIIDEREADSYAASKCGYYLRL